MRGGIIVAGGIMLAMSGQAMGGEAVSRQAIRAEVGMERPSGVATWSEADVAQLRERPRIVRRERGVTASFFVAASPRQAYRILSDHARLPEFMPNLDACTVRAAGRYWVEVEMRNARGQMVLRRHFEPPRAISWSLVESPVLKRVDGSWHFDAAPGGAVLTYDSEVEAALPIPRFIVQFVQQDSMEALISNVRRRIDSNGTWIKPNFPKGKAP